ncbi:MAG: xanthine dehydrogenase family protein molybdopterin-binding subunit [Candidatus Lambdaproteobacteria bacterium]|nr:xanthine dehydrogenase family protein molybdopterin-binding subunit [Candidatus Lambdaproteobacteria bacterium]
MAAYKLIGKDFLPPDVIGKVTGRAKFAEDFRAEGMVFAKLLRSPMPHGLVRRVDAAQALAMKGVLGILTAADLPKVTAPAEPILTSEPLYVGEPILAIAAVDETTAADALDRVKVELEPLPFVLDPLESLRPGGANARTEGNVAAPNLKLQTLKWSARDFTAVREGELPRGKPAEEWHYGDIEAGFRQADLVIEESFITQALAHHAMEPRSALAYWQGGKLFLHGSTQSLAFSIPPLTRILGIEPANLHYVSENTGGGFGSKAAAYTQMAIPAFFAKKLGRPVMLRVSREEEHDFGRSRPGFQGWVKLGFRKDGRLLAADLYIVQSGGPYGAVNDFRNAGRHVSLVYQPLAMRWRGMPVLTNTPPRSAQRSPGETQTSIAMDPVIDKAARKLGLDRVAIRHINAPRSDGTIGPKREPLTSSFLPEALELGAAQFDWAAKQALSGKRTGSKVTGLGVGIGYHAAGNSGFDGLVLIRPDGKLYIHAGAGNLGTYSYAATARAAAEALGMPWERCEIVYGGTGRHVPWTCIQAGSNTTFTITRTNHVAAMDARRKLQEIAAREVGGEPAAFEVGGGRVFLKAEPAKGLAFAEAAQRAIALGGKYSGQELPKDLNPMTARSAAALAGQGLMGVAKDTLPRNGVIPGFCAGYALVEVDVETGQVEIKEYLGVADCGTVIHPKNLGNQILGGAVQGFGMALLEKHVYDPKYGIPATRGLATSKPPTYLDVPVNMRWAAVGKPDPQNPVGAKGAGEPPEGAAAAAVLCAISDALGGAHFGRSPLTCDIVLNAVEGRPQPFKPLDTNI